LQFDRIACTIESVESKRLRVGSLWPVKLRAAKEEEEQDGRMEEERQGNAP